jgi:excisionase family DNA binding protein
MEDDLDLGQAAELLGMSPMALAELLDRGSLPSHLGRDGRHRRIALVDLEAHRDRRFALRQQLAQQARDWRRPTYGPESTTADVVIVA